MYVAFVTFYFLKLLYTPAFCSVLRCPSSILLSVISETLYNTYLVKKLKLFGKIDILARDLKVTRPHRWLISSSRKGNELTSVQDDLTLHDPLFTKLFTIENYRQFFIVTGCAFSTSPSACIAYFPTPPPLCSKYHVLFPWALLRKPGTASSCIRINLDGIRIFDERPSPPRGRKKNRKNERKRETQANRYSFRVAAISMPGETSSYSTVCLAFVNHCPVRLIPWSWRERERERRAYKTGGGMREQQRD